MDRTAMPMWLTAWTGVMGSLLFQIVRGMAPALQECPPTRNTNRVPGAEDTRFSANFPARGQKLGENGGLAAVEGAGPAHAGVRNRAIDVRKRPGRFIQTRRGSAAPVRNRRPSR